MRRGRWDRSSARDDGRPTRLENLALVPTSLLPHKATYQRLANQLPDGAVLVVLPVDDSPERRTLQEAAARLRAKGHAIASLSVDDVLAQARRGRTPRDMPAPTSTPQTGSVNMQPVARPSVDDTAPPAADAPPLVTEPGAIPPFTRELRLVRIDASAAPARYEVLRWQPTLWGGMALMRASGTLGTAPRLRHVLDAATPGPSDALADFIRRRLQAGYRIADWQ